ncbi:MAG TPA: 16S rRNA (uracil(1498)-N(3))-methyltransferase [Allocoleopsis sp.]
MKELQRIAIASEQIENNHINLTSEQNHYLTRVLRLKKGGKFIAIAPESQWLLVTLKDDLNQGEIEEILTINKELPRDIILIVALPKNGFDDIVRQTTEIGVNTIIPVISERTLLKPSKEKILRWQKIAQEASEQSERQMIPQILEPMSFKESLKLFPDINQYICVTRGNYPHLLTCMQQKYDNMNKEQIPLPIIIAIGTEGGWSDQEVNLAIEHGFQPVSLGKRILRTVTAPLVALSIIVSQIEVNNNVPTVGCIRR